MRSLVVNDLIVDQVLPLLHAVLSLVYSVVPGTGGRLQDGRKSLFRFLLKATFPFCKSLPR